MLTVDLIQRKRDGEELAAEEIAALFQAYFQSQVPEYQMAAFLMAVYHSGMTDREVGALSGCILDSGKTLDLTSVPGAKVSMHSTGGVGDKTSLIAAPLAAASGVVVPLLGDRAYGHTGGMLDKLDSLPGFRSAARSDSHRRFHPADRGLDHGPAAVLLDRRRSPRRQGRRRGRGLPPGGSAPHGPVHGRRRPARQ